MLVKLVYAMGGKKKDLASFLREIFLRGKKKYGFALTYKIYRVTCLFNPEVKILMWLL